MTDYKALGVVFSNMHDHNIREITDVRTLGSVPFGGRYRLIDFALSNMVNSGINNVGIITKSNYRSLMDHIGSGREWDLSRKIGGVTILPPYSSVNAGFYRGKVEALSGIMGYITSNNAQYVVMSDSDTVLNIDYRKVVEQHIETGAEITIVYKKDNVIFEQTGDTITCDFDADKRMSDIRINAHTLGEQNVYLNMAVIEKSLLDQLISDAYSHNLYNFDKDILQAKYKTTKIYGYEFDGFCARINCMKSYFKSNMELLEKGVRDQLFQKNRPIYTKVRDEVPATYGNQAKAENCLVADGSIIEGEVSNSIIFRGVKIGKNAVVKNSILMQGTIVGDNAKLDYVIADKNVTIRDNRMLMGFSTYPIFINKGSIV